MFRIWFVIFCIFLHTNKISCNTLFDQSVLQSVTQKTDSNGYYLVDTSIGIEVARCSANYDITNQLAINNPTSSVMPQLPCIHTDNYNEACWVQYAGFIKDKHTLKVCYGKNTLRSDTVECKNIPVLTSSVVNGVNFTTTMQQFNYYNTGYINKKGLASFDCPDVYTDGVNAPGYVYIGDVSNKTCDNYLEELKTQLQITCPNQDSCLCDADCQNNNFIPKTNSTTWQKATTYQQNCYICNQKFRQLAFYCNQAKKCSNSTIANAIIKNQQVAQKLYGTGTYLCATSDNMRCGCAKIPLKGGPRHLPRIARNDTDAIIKNPDCNSVNTKWNPTCNLFTSEPFVRQFRDFDSTNQSSICTNSKQLKAENGWQARGTFFRPKLIVKYGATEGEITFLKNIDTKNTTQSKLVDQVKDIFTLTAVDNLAMPYLLTSKWDNTIYAITATYDKILPNGNCAKEFVTSGKNTTYIITRIEYNLRTTESSLVAYSINTSTTDPTTKMSTNNKINSNNGQIVVLTSDENIQQIIMPTSNSPAFDTSIQYDRSNQNGLDMIDNTKSYTILTKIGSVARPPIKYFYDTNGNIISPVKIQDLPESQNSYLSDYVNPILITINPGVLNGIGAEFASDAKLPPQSDANLVLLQWRPEAFTVNSSGKHTPVVYDTRCTFLYGHRFCIKDNDCDALSNFTSKYLTSPPNSISDCNNASGSEKLACLTTLSILNKCNAYIGCPPNETKIENCQQNRIPEIKINASQAISEYKAQKDFRAMQTICLSSGIEMPQGYGAFSNTTKFGLYGNVAKDYTIAMARPNQSNFPNDSLRPITYIGLDTFDATQTTQLDDATQILPFPSDYLNTKDKSNLITYLKNNKAKDINNNFLSISVFDKYSSFFNNCSANDSACQDKITARLKSFDEMPIGTFCVQKASSKFNTWLIDKSRRSQNDYNIYIPLRCQLLTSIVAGAGGAGATEVKGDNCSLFISEGVDSVYLPRYSSSGRSGSITTGTLDTQEIAKNTNYNPVYLNVAIGERTGRCNIRFDNKTKQLNCHNLLGTTVYSGGCHKYVNSFTDDPNRQLTYSQFFNFQKGDDWRGDTVIQSNNQLVAKSVRGSSTIDLMLDEAIAMDGGSLVGSSKVPRIYGCCYFGSSETVVNRAGTGVADMPRYANLSPLPNTSFFNNLFATAGSVNYTPSSESKMATFQPSQWSVQDVNIDPACYSGMHIDGNRTFIGNQACYLANGPQIAYCNGSIIASNSCNNQQASTLIPNKYNQFNNQPSGAGAINAGGDKSNNAIGTWFDAPNNDKATGAGGTGYLKIIPANITYVTTKTNTTYPMINSDGVKTYNINGRQDKQCRVKCPLIHIKQNISFITTQAGDTKSNVEAICEYSSSELNDMEGVFGKTYSPKKCTIISKDFDSKGNSLYGRILTSATMCPIAKCVNKVYINQQTDITALQNDRYYGLCQYDDTLNGTSNPLSNNLRSNKNVYSGMAFDGSKFTQIEGTLVDTQQSAVIAKCANNELSDYIIDTSGVLTSDALKLTCSENGFWQSSYIYNTIVKSNEETFRIYKNLSQSDDQYQYKNEYNEMAIKARYTEFSAINRTAFVDQNNQSLYYCPAISSIYDYDSEYSGNATWSHAIEKSMTYGSCTNITNISKQRILPQAANMPPPSRYCKTNGVWSAVKNPCGITCPDETINGVFWQLPATIVEFDQNLPTVTVNGAVGSNIYDITAIANTNVASRICNLTSGRWNAPFATSINNTTPAIVCPINNAIYRSPALILMNDYDMSQLKKNGNQNINSIVQASFSLVTDNSFYIDMQLQTINGQKYNVANNIIASWKEISSTDIKCNTNPEYCSTDGVLLLDNTINYVQLEFQNNFNPVELSKAIGYTTNSDEFDNIKNWLGTLMYDNKNYTNKWSWNCGLSKSLSNIIIRNTSATKKRAYQDNRLYIMIPYKETNNIQADTITAMRIAQFSPYLATQYAAVKGLNNSLQNSDMQKITLMIPSIDSIFLIYPMLLNHKTQAYSERVVDIKWKDQTSIINNPTFAETSIPKNCNTQYGGFIRHNTIKNIMYTPVITDKEMYFATIFCYDGVIFGYSAVQTQISFDDTAFINKSCLISFDQAAQTLLNNIKIRANGMYQDTNHVYLNTRMMTLMGKYWADNTFPEDALRFSFEQNYPNKTQDVQMVIDRYAISPSFYARPTPRRSEWIFNRGAIILLDDIIKPDSLDPFCQLQSCKDNAITTNIERNYLNPQWSSCDAATL